MNKKSVLIVGGTHGNELPGINVLRKLATEQPTFPGLSVEFILGNPKAIESHSRFFEEDLNRCFSDPRTGSTYERERAYDLKQTYTKKVDLIIDFHSTTASMGTTIIVTQINDVMARLITGMKRSVPDLKVLLYVFQEACPFLMGIAPNCFVIELGPVPHNTTSEKVEDTLEQLVRNALQTLSQPPSNKDDGGKEIEVYRIERPVNLSEGNKVHPNLSGKDYEYVEKGAPLIVDRDSDKVMQVAETAFYPVFINEEEYLKKGIGFFETTRHTWHPQTQSFR
jgi:succinylglutamate desuccinylase